MNTQLTLLVVFGCCGFAFAQYYPVTPYYDDDYDTGVDDYYPENNPQPYYGFSPYRGGKHYYDSEYPVAFAPVSRYNPWYDYPLLYRMSRGKKGGGGGGGHGGFWYYYGPEQKKGWGWGEDHGHHDHHHGHHGGYASGHGWGWKPRGWGLPKLDVIIPLWKLKGWGWKGW